MMSKDTRNAISSPESPAGPTQLDLLDGLTTDHSGPDLVPVNRSALRANKKVSKTSATSGQLGSISSQSAALQLSWESRLRVLLTGGPECEVTWNGLDTPLGRNQFKPRARVRASYGIDYGLWPAMRRGDGATGKLKFPPRMDHKSRIEDFMAQVVFALWPANRASPNENRNTKGCPSHGNGHGLTVAGLVQDVIRLSTWPAMTANAKAKDGYNEAGNSAGQVAIRKIARATDGEKGGPNQSFVAEGSPLPSQVCQTALSSSNAPTESTGGSLHPEFAGWEMGFPPEFLNCAPSEIPSTRRSPRK